jgi:hypothetical protein
MHTIVHAAQLFPPYLPPPTLLEEKKKEREGATKRERERSTKNKALVGFILCFSVFAFSCVFSCVF